MRTIRQRVTLLATLLTAGLLAAVALLTVLVLRWQLTDNLDEGLSQRADTLAAFVDGSLPSELPGDEDLLIQVVASDNTIIASSANLAGQPPLGPPQPGYHTIKITGRAETFRTLNRPLTSTRILVGVNYDHVTEPVAIVTSILAIAIPLVVAALATLVWWLTGRTLRPVERMRSELADIGDTNLTRRVLRPGRGDEIDRLAHTMNATLDRLEEAVRKQQRFVGDASHELRTPLTRIRTQLEVDLARPDWDDPADTRAGVLADVIALQHLVDDLLDIARIDAPTTAATFTLLDLDDIVLREVRRLAERERVTVNASAVSAAQVNGNGALLTRAVRNVLDNAERHATHTVTVELVEDDNHVRLEVSDDGNGIPPTERQHIFDRFTRLDEARTRDHGGAGLGLAITRDILTRHHGTIDLTDDPHTTFVILLPRTC